MAYQITFIFYFSGFVIVEWSEYRLLQSIKPVHHDINLKAYLDPNNQGQFYQGNHSHHFDGEVSILIDVVEATDTVVLNSYYLDYFNVFVREETTSRELAINRYYTNEGTQYLFIELGERLAPGERYHVVCSYMGYLMDNNFGFYLG